MDGEEFAIGEPALDTAPPIEPVRVGLAGGTLGAAMAAAVLVAAYALASHPSIEGVLGLRFVLGPDGITVGDPYRIAAAWASGPLAAFASGWLLARRALARSRWSGAWMGAATYVFGLVIAILSFTLVDVIAQPSLLSIVSAVAQLGFLLLFGSVVLAPLLVVCIAAGAIWAEAIRIIPGLPLPAPGVPAGRALSGRVLLVVVAVLAGLWVFVGGLTFAAGGLGPID